MSSKVPLPERGQPLDVTYLSVLASAINDLSASVSSVGKNSYTSIDVSGNQNDRKVIKTSDAKIVGGYATVTNATPNNAGSEKEFVYRFDKSFSFVPVVTITPITLGDSATTASKDVSVVITQVNVQEVTGIVTFKQTGISSVGINLIAIGIPGSSA
jgi:hypothetical protein